jgi:hemoglobin
MTVKSVPTLYEWAGGMAALERLTNHFYRRVRQDEMRKRWMTVLLESADAVGLPDPEFRSALVSYIEWGSRLAVINSQPGQSVESNSPMPHWGWGEVGGPYRA